MAEVERARNAFEAPAAPLWEQGQDRLVRLDDVETLLQSDAPVIDACRNVVRMKGSAVSLASRPVLLALARVLGETWPDQASREELLQRADSIAGARSTRSIPRQALCSVRSKPIAS